jgi:hypothetical protein
LDVTGIAPVAQVQNLDEQLGRAYVFWTPHRTVALSAQYLYEQLKTNDFVDLTGSPAKLDTHRFPLGVRWFHRSGFSAAFIATYVDQQGTFAGNVEDEEKFWVYDAAISYRLPKRYGLITVGASNLTDEEFRYFDTDRKNPTLQPQRMAYARITIALP